MGGGELPTLSAACQRSDEVGIVREIAHAVGFDRVCATLLLRQKLGTIARVSPLFFRARGAMT